MATPTARRATAWSATSLRHRERHPAFWGRPRRSPVTACRVKAPTSEFMGQWLARAQPGRTLAVQPGYGVTLGGQRREDYPGYLAPPTRTLPASSSTTAPKFKRFLSKTTRSRAPQTSLRLLELWADAKL